jgi:hypothetical protein
MFRHPNLPGADRPSGEIGGRFLTDFNVWHDHRSPRRAKGFTGNQNLQSRPPENWPLPPFTNVETFGRPATPIRRTGHLCQGVPGRLEIAARASLVKPRGKTGDPRGGLSGRTVFGNLIPIDRRLPK